MGGDPLVVDEGSHVGIGRRVDGRDLVRRAEPVEEVEKRHARLEGGCVRHEREVGSLLDRARSQHRPSRGAGGHDVAVVPEDRECMGRDRSGRDVNDGGESSPAILNMFGSMRSSPWDAVNVVARAPRVVAPWRVPAAPASDCISMTSGTVPQRLGRPVAAHASQCSAIGDAGVIG